MSFEELESSYPLVVCLFFAISVLMLLLSIPRLPYGYYVLLGSCAEMEAQITVVKELKYMAEDKETDLLERLDYICRMT